MIESDLANKKERPGIGRFFWQAAAIGTLIGFSLPVMFMLSHPGTQFNSFVLIYVSFAIAYGIFFASVEAIILWIFSYLAGHHLHVLVLAGIGIAVPGVVFGVWIFSQRNNAYLAADEYLSRIVFYGVAGGVCGLVIGSNSSGAT